MIGHLTLDIIDYFTRSLNKKITWHERHSKLYVDLNHIIIRFTTNKMYKNFSIGHDRIAT